MSERQTDQNSASTPTPTDPLLAAHHWLSLGRSLAVATVIETWGSAAVPVGGQLIIADDETFQGSVSGGCVEADVIAASDEVIASGKPQALTFGVSNETAWRSGLACGGQIKVLVAPLQPATDLATLEALIAAKSNRKTVALVTDLTSGAISITVSGDPAMTNTDRGAIAEALRTETSCTISQDGHDAFVHVMVPPPRLIIVGATEIAQHLSRMAVQCQYDVIIVDPRPAFTSENRFNADHVTTAWPQAVLPSLLIDPHAVVVTLTHADAIDDEALAIALRSPTRYIGALGARRTHKARVERLQSSGFTQADIDRIRAPIGLDIAAKSPAEIAVSILGEIIATFRRPPA